MKTNIFFDFAATSPCCEEASLALGRFCQEEFANPSSAHAAGQKAAFAIRQSRLFFADHFQVEPEQVIFTGSGTEANSLALTGSALSAVVRKDSRNKVVCSAIEHPSVLANTHALKDFGFKTDLAPVDSKGEVISPELEKLVSEQTLWVSIMRVNNVIGSQNSISDLAEKIKSSHPEILFHSDCIQAFTKVELPRAPSAVDCISISAHKFEGPKGIGALIVFNRDLLQKKLIRPLSLGGGQEFGMRSGTSPTGLIVGMEIAARRALEEKRQREEKITRLQSLFRTSLTERRLLSGDSSAPFVWNSPKGAVPNIVNLSCNGFPSGPFSMLLEEHGIMISSGGSACSSKKQGPDHVLSAIGVSEKLANAGLRISFSHRNTEAEIQKLVDALEHCQKRIGSLMGSSRCAS